MDGHDAGVLESRQDARLARETPREIAACVRHVQHLQRHAPRECQVLGFVDGAHAARAHAPDEPVARAGEVGLANGLAEGDRGRRRRASRRELHAEERPRLEPELGVAHRELAKDVEDDAPEVPPRGRELIRDVDRRRSETPGETFIGRLRLDAPGVTIEVVRGKEREADLAPRQPRSLRGNAPPRGRRRSAPTPFRRNPPATPRSARRPIRAPAARPRSPAKGRPRHRPASAGRRP